MVRGERRSADIYDMCKSVDKGIVIEAVRLLEKTGARAVTGTPLSLYGRHHRALGSRAAGVRPDACIP